MSKKKAAEPVTDLAAMRQSVLAKQEELRKAQRELYDMQKKDVFATMSTVAFDEAELAVFVSGLEGLQNKADVCRAILAAAQTAKLDVESFQRRLIRMGLL